MLTNVEGCTLNGPHSPTVNYHISSKILSHFPAIVELFGRVQRWDFSTPMVS
ncbi:hypothetical protein CPB83DRAFT_854925 [Crepidotus variabilis]|uniref:Uncharacterized protein n=1 Tax=Crepidotus variabilis TaxID=179855 RepID=A0A9P6EFL8_9AGAR|nr:hypothetical protein CPB83DRAFT_854925 [Crepidotus variabilis]